MFLYRFRSRTIRHILHLFRYNRRTIRIHLIKVSKGDLLSFKLSVRHPALIIVLRRLCTIRTRLLTLTRNVARICLKCIFRLPILRSYGNSILSYRVAIVEVMTWYAVKVMRLSELGAFLLWNVFSTLLTCTQRFVIRFR